MANPPTVQIHDYASLENFNVSRSSATLGWSNAFLSIQSVAPYSASFDAVPSVLIFIVRDGSLRATVDLDGSSQSLQSPPGGIGIVADNVPFRVDLRSYVETTHLYLKRALIDEVASGIYGEDQDRVEILSRFCIFDAVIEALCTEIQDAIDEDSDFSFSYIDYLARAVAAHLIRNYSDIKSRREPLSQATRLDTRFFERTRELIETRLSERLTVAELAAGTGLSADHFGRLFKRSAGVTLRQFIIRRRVSRASHMLETTIKPIIEIAHECGFADQVHLTRAFGRIMGTTPAAFRNQRKNVHFHSSGDRLL